MSKRNAFKLKANGQLANYAEAQLHFREVSPALNGQFLKGNPNSPYHNGAITLYTG